MDGKKKRRLRREGPKQLSDFFVNLAGVRDRLLNLVAQERLIALSHSPNSNLNRTFGHAQRVSHGSVRRPGARHKATLRSKAQVAR